jgi:hypothetical protein
VRLPETDMHTVGVWWTVPQSITESFANDALQGALMGIANLLCIVTPI